MKRAKLMSIAVVAALTGAGACTRAPARADGESRGGASALAVSWIENQSYVYSVRLVSRAELGQSSPFDIDLATKLEVVPLRVQGSTAELSITPRAPMLTAGHAGATPELDALAAELAHPALVTLERGRVAEERFGLGLSPPAVAILRALAAAYQVRSPAGASDTKWTAAEYDGTGRYLAEYERLPAPGTVAKHKLRYEEVLFSGKIDAANRARVAPAIVASTGEVRVAGGVLAAVHSDDSVTSQVLAGSALTVHTTVDLALDAGFPVRREGGQERSPHEHAALVARTAAIAPGQVYGARPARGLFDNARISGRTFAQLLAEIEAQAKDGGGASDLWAAKNDVQAQSADLAGRKERLDARVSTFGALVALLRQQPEAVAAAERAVRARSPAATKLMDALAAAGTETAQDALVELVTKGALPPPVRVAGATSLIRVNELSASTVEALRALLDDPLLGEHAVFGLGTAARRLREAGKADRARAISELLLERLGQANDPRARVRCLRGIANSAFTDALDRVRPYAAADDRFVRAAAVEAARLMDDPRADAFIAERMRTDKDARVRMTAIAVAQMRAPSPALGGALAALAVHDDNPVARRRAVDLMGRWLAEQPSLRLALEEVAWNDQSAQVRSAARAALDRGAHAAGVRQKT